MKIILAFALLGLAALLVFNEYTLVGALLALIVLALTLLDNRS